MTELTEDNIREKVWLHAWTMVASANDCKSPTAATKWADSCLEEFDKRFPRPMKTNKTKINFLQERTDSK
jgi:hypothetical protein